ncbi:MAG: hypothetical protein ABIQ70_13000 [Dokdonella sp.]
MASLISYRNLADTATVTASVAPDGGFPLANMKTRQLSQCTRWTAIVSSGVATVDLFADLGATLGLQKRFLFGVHGVNVQRAFGSLILSLGAYSGTSLAGPWTLECSSNVNDGFTGIPSQVIAAFGAAMVSAKRYWKMTVTWTTTDTFGQIGRMWLGDSIAIDKGITTNWSMSVVDPGTLDLSAGQQAYENKKTRVRVLRCGYTGMPALQAYGFAEGSTSAQDIPSIQDLQMTAGTTGEVIVLPRSTPSLWVRRAGVYGHLDAGTPPTITHIAGDNYSVDLTVVEER